MALHRAKIVSDLECIKASMHAPQIQAYADCSPASAASTTNSEIPLFSVLVAAKSGRNQMKSCSIH